MGGYDKYTAKIISCITRGTKKTGKFASTKTVFMHNKEPHPVAAAGFSQLAKALENELFGNLGPNNRPNDHVLSTNGRCNGSWLGHSNIRRRVSAHPAPDSPKKTLRL